MRAQGDEHKGSKCAVDIARVFCSSHDPNGRVRPLKLVHVLVDGRVRLELLKKDPVPIGVAAQKRCILITFLSPFMDLS